MFVCIREKRESAQAEKKTKEGSQINKKTEKNDYNNGIILWIKKYCKNYKKYIREIRMPMYMPIIINV